jgi:hypothetical protein
MALCMDSDYLVIISIMKINNLNKLIIQFIHRIVRSVRMTSLPLGSQKE